MMSEIRLTLPLPPNRANQSYGKARWEWAAKKRYMNGNTRLLGAIDLALGQIPQCDDLPLDNVTISATLYVKNLMDDDNLKARLKFPLDTLVKAGILVDDSPKHCTVLKPEQVIDRKNMRVELVLATPGEES